MKIFLFFSLLFTGITLIWITIYSDNHPKTYNKCGTVLNKTDGAKYIEHKHGDEVQSVLYLDIRYENNYVERVEVNANTYYNYTIGNHICLIKEIEESGWVWWHLLFILGFIFIIIDIFWFINYIIE